MPNSTTTDARYRALNAYCRERFGTKLYKLALDGGMTCPNRDGSLDTRGCIFCSAHGSGDFTTPGDVPTQLAKARALVADKAKNARYIAYFQNFTNTYAPVATLEPLYRAAMAPNDVAVLSIATRPDCIPDDVLDLLARLNREKPVWVELGLQTIHAASAAYIRRGYDLAVYDDAVRRLRAAGIEVITHMILGLPDETPAMMRETAAYIGHSGVQGIKLQLLHVLRGTDLADDYAAGRFAALTLDEYLAVLADCISVLPPETVIHRLTGDGAKRDLIAPLWSGDKKRVLNAITAYFHAHNIKQGAKYGAE